MGIPSLEALMQVNLKTMLKVDQPSFAWVHTTCDKKWNWPNWKQNLRLPQFEVMASTIPKNFLMFPHWLY
jgi:hypothetical protein